MWTQARPISYASAGREAPARDGGRRPGLAFGALVLALVLLPAPRALAQETFLGVPVSPHAGTYKALKDVNVRAKPATSGKRVGGLRKGELVQAAGRSKDGVWLALTKDGKELGFVYAPLLRIVIAAPVVFTRPMTPASGTYLVSKDVRVRANPKTKSEEINRLSKGERGPGRGQGQGRRLAGRCQGRQELRLRLRPGLAALDRRHPGGGPQGQGVHRRGPELRLRNPLPRARTRRRAGTSMYPITKSPTSAHAGARRSNSPP